MKNFIVTAIIVAAIITLFVCSADARIFGRRRSTGSTSTASHVARYGTDQQRCQAEAEYMAANGITGHVGTCIGRFEGCGFSTSRHNVGTCMPGSGMRLTGDFIAKGRNGFYRVRSWR